MSNTNPNPYVRTYMYVRIQNRTLSTRSSYPAIRNLPSITPFRHLRSCLDFHFGISIFWQIGNFDGRIVRA